MKCSGFIITRALLTYCSLGLESPRCFIFSCLSFLDIHSGQDAYSYCAFLHTFLSTFLIHRTIVIGTYISISMLYMILKQIIYSLLFILSRLMTAMIIMNYFFVSDQENVSFLTKPNNYKILVIRAFSLAKMPCFRIRTLPSFVHKHKISLVSNYSTRQHIIAQCFYGLDRNYNRTFIGH